MEVSLKQMISSLSKSYKADHLLAFELQSHKFLSLTIYLLSWIFGAYELVQRIVYLT